MARPVLVSSCARAATAKEAAFRIGYPLAAARHTRVVAMDADAETAVRSVSKNSWAQARFYSAAGKGQEFVGLDGETDPLSVMLEGSNSVIMVATAAVNAAAVATLGAACQVRSIMTAGLLLTPGVVNSDAMQVLRPYARMLLVPADESDLFELLVAIRA